MTKTIYEILKEAAGRANVAERARVLQENSSKGLKCVLGYALDPRVKWLIPDGIPPYRQQESHEAQGQFTSLATKLFYFVDGPDKIKDRFKREQMYISMLEDVDPQDALVLLTIKEKALPFPQITREVVTKAFPKLVADWPAEATKPTEDTTKPKPKKKNG